MRGFDIAEQALTINLLPPQDITSAVLTHSVNAALYTHVNVIIAVGVTTATEFEFSAFASTLESGGAETEIHPSRIYFMNADGTNLDPHPTSLNFGSGETYEIPVAQDRIIGTSFDVAAFPDGSRWFGLQFATTGAAIQISALGVLTGARMSPPRTPVEIPVMHPAIEARFALTQPWALSPTNLHALAHSLSSPAAFTGTSSARQRQRRTTGKRVALVSVRGIILHRDSLLSVMLGTSAESIIRQVRDADDAETILMDVDSPGGSVAGIKEVAAVVAQAAKSKRVIASINALGASAAYWIASQAAEIVITPSGQVGSIGVIASHIDESRALDREGIRITNIVAGRYKAEATSDQPLGDEARAEMQRTVDSFFFDFVSAVAKGRGVSTQHVIGNMGEGRLMRARPAKAAKMVDRIASFDEVLSGLGVALAPPSRHMSQAERVGDELLAQGFGDWNDAFKAGETAGALGELKRQTKAKPRATVPAMSRDDELAKRMQLAKVLA